MDGEAMTDNERWAELKRKSFDLLDRREALPDGNSFSDEEAAHIMAQALTNLEPDEVSAFVNALDENRPDVLGEWNELKVRARAQPPPPRPRGRDSGVSAVEQQRWNAAFDARWVACMEGYLAPEPNPLEEAVGIGLALARKEARQLVRKEIGVLRREIEALRGELERKQAPPQRAAEVAGWAVDCQRFTVQPILSDNSKGPVLDLYALFQRLHDEVSQ
jgi:hypothetical protein